MSKIVYIHNPHQAESRNILQNIIDANISHEVIDFMDIRNQYRFRATPTLLILPNNADIEEKNVAVELEENFTVDDINNKLNSARIITLSASKTTITINEELIITATMTDIEGNSVSIEPITFYLSGMQISDEDGILEFSAQEAGTYIIETKNADSVQGYIEVTVNG